MRSACRLRIGILLLAAAWPAAAQDRPGAAPDLDRLLKLPGSVEYSSERRGGATRSEWRQRFHDARVRVADAGKALEKAQADLAKTVGSKSEWQFTPPGMPSQASEDSSSAFLLRQEVKKRREEKERAEYRLRELDVEANLAGVPEDWRDESTEAISGNGSGDASVTTPAARR